MIAGVSPTPADRGDRIRAQQVLRSLVRRFHVDLMLVGTSIDDRDKGDLEALGVNCYTAPVSMLHRGQSALRGLVTRRPLTVLHSYRLDRQFVVREPYDVVLAFQLKVAPLAIKVPGKVHVLELTDSLGLYRSLLPRNAPALRRLALVGAELEEAHWVRQYDFTVVSSPRDQEAIRQFVPEAEIVVVENAATAWPSPVRPGVKRSLVFVGNLHYPPNQTGVLEFVERHWDRIHQASQLTLRVVGASPPPMAKLARRPGVELTGHLKDLHPEYNQALALVNPIPYGTGTRSKILGAWAAGLPVISSTPGALGLEYEVGNHLLLADDTDEWVERVLALQSNYQLWSQMSAACYHHAKTRYDSEKVWDREFIPLFSQRGML